MKLLLYFTLAIVLFSCTKGKDADPMPKAVDTLNTGWKKISLPTTEPVNDIFFIDNNTGFAIAGRAIFRSVNGGNNWQEVYQSGKYLYNINMGNANNAIFVTPSKLVLYTRDGGNSFDSLELNDNTIDDVFFVNATTAFAVGKKTWKTTNAGISWNELSSFSSTPYANLKSLHFSNEQTGWTTGNGLFKTTNAGITWDLIPAASGGPLPEVGNIYFPDVNTGFATDESSVYKTTNGGTSFTKVLTTTPAFHDIHFTSLQKGYITDNNYIRITTDSGQTWNREVFIAGKHLIELHFTDASHGWAGGANGLILVYKQ
jgi:photosystem II stability/assembly factor-like uncharacterized protein